MFAATLRRNVFSGLTVALAMVPEAIAFAFVAHVSPLVGLYAAFIVCLVTSAFGGRPGMVSGANGALAVVMVALVSTHGVQYLFAAVVLMGVIQILLGLLRIGKYVRMIPHPVMLGFVNGLAVVIFLAQLGHFKANGVWLDAPALWLMLALAALTMALIYWLPRLHPGLPAPLIAVIAVSLLVTLCGWHTRTVGDMASIAGGWPRFALPAVPLDWQTLRIVLPYSAILAAVGLVETLLTLNLIDEMSDTRGQPNRECLAQGAANILCGVFGGMGGGAMIGQSMINVNNGGLRRVSGIVTALALIAFVLFLSRWIAMIPLAALAGVMFVVCQKTFAWGSLRLIGKVPRADLWVIVAVTVTTVLADLAIAVLVGVIISALVFAWEQAKRIRVARRVDGDTAHYAVEGTLFFASTTAFAAAFAPKEDPALSVVDFAGARLADHSAIEALDALAARYRALGKTVRLRHLSPDCRALLERAAAALVIEAPDDPRYYVADDRID